MACRPVIVVLRALVWWIASGALCAGCSDEPALDERAVVRPVGWVRDLSLLQAGGGMALGWRQSVSPNGGDARAALLLLGSQRRPRGEVLQDDNPSTESSALVATATTILRVLAEHEEPDEWGLVVVVRDVETGELLPDGYRTLPVFAGATLTDLRLVPTLGGALLSWVERAGPAADLVQLVALDALGTPRGPPLALTALPTDVVHVDLEPTADRQGALLAALARRGESAQLWSVQLAVDDAVTLQGDPRQLTANLSADDRVVDLASDGECVELLVTQGGRPARGTMRLDNLAATQLEALGPEDAAPGVAPRLLEGDGAGLHVLTDRPDGTTRVRAIEHGNACRALVGEERVFPLPRHRCTELATLPGDPLPYACATSCLTEDCGEQWIYVGDARF